MSEKRLPILFIVLFMTATIALVRLRRGQRRLPHFPHNLDAGRRHHDATR